MDHFRRTASDMKLNTSPSKYSSLSTMSSLSCKKSSYYSSKTPVKTPLRLNVNTNCLSTQKKKTPFGGICSSTSSNNLTSGTAAAAAAKTNDRYIPNRVSSNLEVGYHLMSSQENQENAHLFDHVKRKLISETCAQSGEGNNGESKSSQNDKRRVLNLHTRQQANENAQFVDNLKTMYTINTSMNTSIRRTGTGGLRHIITQPEKILDAPDYKDDFYLNLIDWSTNNVLAVALNKDLYLWNATTKEISQLYSMDENTPSYISSVAWIQKGNVLAVGTSDNCIELWDVQKQARLRRMQSNISDAGHRHRIGSLAWNKHLLSAGTRSGLISHNDVRVAQHQVGSCKFHTQEVCGLKWSPGGSHLASGANDNLVAVWDNQSVSNGGESSQPLQVYREHTAAIKALSWCPWQSSTIATGGGTADGFIRIWNIYNGHTSQSVDCKSQISSILWSQNHRELISSHGFPHNQLCIWKSSDLSKICDLTGHTNRVLMMGLSPDEETLASIGADETLRLWKCFALDDKQKRSNNSTLGDSMSHANLSRSIR